MTMRKCYACSSMSENKQPLNEFPNKFKINKKIKKIYEVNNFDGSKSIKAYCK